MYDYVIVGGGPSGLAFAQCCVKFKKKVLIIEKEDSVGGCHRVRRVDGVFTEHGPRIYSDSYKVFISLLEDMGLHFGDFFTKYDFQMSAIGNETLWNVLSPYEFLAFAWNFMNLIFNDNFGHNISMLEVMDSYNFSANTRDIIDRLCRLTDGAGSDRYTLNEFLSLFNQQLFYNIYQPKKPLDVGLFKAWKEYLDNSGYVDILLGSKVQSLNVTKLNSVSGVVVETDGTTTEYTGKQFILAIPPANSYYILQRMQVEAVVSFKDWANATRYNEYISLTFHYDTKLDLPSVYGFPKSDWGVAYILLSDYMTFDEKVSQTVFSLTFCYNDRKSKYSGKTADECSEKELVEEAYMQLRESYPDLPRPTLALLSPGVVRDSETNTWKSIDTAFMKTSSEGFIPFKVGDMHNLFTLGTHNGYHKYNFTSMEAAVSNAVALSHKLIQGSDKVFMLEGGWKLTDVMRIVILVVLLIAFKKYVPKP
jgi:hypothetical protein